MWILKGASLGWIWTVNVTSSFPEPRSTRPFRKSSPVTILSGDCGASLSLVAQPAQKTRLDDIIKVASNGLNLMLSPPTDCNHHCGEAISDPTGYQTDSRDYRSRYPRCEDT